MRRNSQIETSLYLWCRAKIGSINSLFLAVLFVSVPQWSFAQKNLCSSIFKVSVRSAVIEDRLGKQDGVQIKNPSLAFLTKLELNNEPALQYLRGERSYKAPNLKIYDNRRLYEPRFMLRFDGMRLIKMFRGLRLEEGTTLEMTSERKGRPIWIAPDYEHARLYAQEWTPVENADKATAIVLEMWVPEFMIYWRNDPREEGMTEAFILDKDLQTLESFVTKVHKLTPKSHKSQQKQEASDVTLDDYYRFGYPPY